MRTEDFSLPPQWILKQNDEFIAMYENTNGDILSLNYFPRVPDIAADVSDADALRAFYRGVAESNNIAMVEVDSVQIAGLKAVRAILKARLQPTGFVFIGSYTLPFSDCSYVVKVQSIERGTTGVRETALMIMQPTPVEVDELTDKIVGWEQDPYDPSYRGPFMRNQADDQKYDDQFPEHPLSKVRSYLNELATDLQVAPSIHALTPFKYKAPKAGIWPRLWR